MTSNQLVPIFGEKLISEVEYFLQYLLYTFFYDKASTNTPLCHAMVMPVWNLTYKWVAYSANHSGIIRENDFSSREPSYTIWTC